MYRYQDHREINSFSKGDIIHRVKKNFDGDASYMAQPLEFLAIEQDVIFLKAKEERFGDDKLVMLPLARWDDNGWGHFPKEKMEELKAEMKNK